MIAADAPAIGWRVSRRSLRALGLGLLYALLIVMAPWEDISRAGFTDFDTYVDTFVSYEQSAPSSDQSAAELTLSEYVFGEALWHEIAARLTYLVGDAVVALRIVSFFILSVWGIFLFKRLSPGMALLFLLNPTCIDVAMSGLRNGFAWALVMIGLSFSSKTLRVAMFAIGALIHSSTFVLLALYYGIAAMAPLFKGRSLLIVSVGGGVLFGLALTIGSQLILGALGDRRTGEEYVVGGGSLLQASMWGILLVLQCLSPSEYVRKHAFVIALLCWYLTMNPFIPWSFRVWGAFLPVIAVAALELSPPKRLLFIWLYVIYLFAQILYWTTFFEYWHAG